MVVLLGDFHQLPPLFKANAINPSGHNLYQLLDKAITFTELVQQQGADEQEHFTAQLMRLVEGVFTKENWRSWRGRDLNMLHATEKAIFLDNAILACARKKI